MITKCNKCEFCDPVNLGGTVNTPLMGSIISVCFGSANNFDNCHVQFSDKSILRGKDAKIVISILKKASKSTENSIQLARNRMTEIKYELIGHADIFDNPLIEEYKFLRLEIKRHKSEIELNK